MPTGSPQKVLDPASPAGTVGAAAVSVAVLPYIPLSLYSSYVLVTTGSGLPAGPNGVYGAAEGFATLTVFLVSLWSLVSFVTRARGLPAGPLSLLGAAQLGSYLAVLAFAGATYLTTGDMAKSNPFKGATPDQIVTKVGSTIEGQVSTVSAPLKVRGGKCERGHEEPDRLPLADAVQARRGGGQRHEGGRRAARDRAESGQRSAGNRAESSQPEAREGRAGDSDGGEEGRGAEAGEAGRGCGGEAREASGEEGRGEAGRGGQAQGRAELRGPLLVGGVRGCAASAASGLPGGPRLFGLPQGEDVAPRNPEVRRPLSTTTATGRTG
ncbi:unnamed protein product, partial [Prorocentrum cordatum]